MKKLFITFCIAVVSSIAMAAPRAMSSTLPSNTPSVTITLDGKTSVVTPTSVKIEEIDANSVRCTVFANKDKAEVVLPISFDTCLDLAMRAVTIAHEFNLINDSQYEAAKKEYARMTNKSN